MGHIDAQEDRWRLMRQTHDNDGNEIVVEFAVYVTIVVYVV